MRFSGAQIKNLSVVLHGEERSVQLVPWDLLYFILFFILSNFILFFLFYQISVPYDHTVEKHGSHFSLEFDHRMGASGSVDMWSICCS